MAQSLQEEKELLEAEIREKINRKKALIDAESDQDTGFQNLSKK